MKSTFEDSSLLVLGAAHQLPNLADLSQNSPGGEEEDPLPTVTNKKQKRQRKTRILGRIRKGLTGF